jgi:type IV secretory pathway VirB2 component (pilin)
MSKRIMKALSLALLVAGVAILFAEPAFAAAVSGGTSSSSSAGTLTATLCRVVAFASGGPAKAVMAILIIAMGLGAFFGKINTSIVITFAVAASLVLGPIWMIKKITGEDPCQLYSTEMQDAASAAA